MFKNLTVFQATTSSPLDYSSIESALKQAAFVPGGAQQEKSIGWTPPRGSEHDAFLEAIGGHWLATLKIETRTVPTSELNKCVEAIAEALEASAGRKPNRKELKEMKDHARTQLLPKAFAKISTIPVWIDPTSGLVGIGTATQNKIDDVVTALVRAFTDLSLEEWAQRVSAVAAMREWLLQENDALMPEGFSLGKECVLRHEGEGKATARFTNQDLACEEVRQNLRAGKEPVSMGLSCGEHVDMVLHASARIKSIRIVADTGSQASKKDSGDLDADFTLFTSEMSAVIQQLKKEIDNVSTRIEKARDASNAAIQGITSMWGASAVQAEATA